MGRHNSGPAYDIYEMYRGKTRFRAHLPIGADAADMAGIPKPEYRETIRLCFRNRHLGRLLGDRLTVTTIAVDDQERTAVGDDGNRLVGTQFVAVQGLIVARDHADTVARMSFEMRFDKVVGDDLRFFERASPGF